MTSMEDRGHLVQLIFGAMAAETIGTAARLGLADRIGDGERSGAELASETAMDPISLTRLLRALASLELLNETSPGRFQLSGSGTLLRTDRPDSMHAFVRMFLDPTILAAWRELDTAVRTRQTTFDQVFGTSFFDHLAANPGAVGQFNAAMR
jgi:hypothetical protein